MATCPGVTTCDTVALRVECPDLFRVGALSRSGRNHGNRMNPLPPSEPPPPADELEALHLEVAALRVAVANLRTLVEYQGHRTGTTPVRWLVAPPSVAPGPHPPSHGFHRTP